MFELLRNILYMPHKHRSKKPYLTFGRLLIISWKGSENEVKPLG
jgi:hypothetical protein